MAGNPYAQFASYSQNQPPAQGVPAAAKKKKVLPPPQEGAPPPVNPYANFANYSQSQPPAAAQPPAQPAGSQQESALKKFRAKHGL
jgi:hypothetical protein